MPTDCSADLFGFAPVEGREVVAAFDGGAITSDAGGLLLSATDRALDLMRRLTACFSDVRKQHLIEHEVVTLIAQRVFAIALGYEDLNDHDKLRKDPVMAVLAGKLAARRQDCEPVAGKSTLNRLELSRAEPTRYHKISHDQVGDSAMAHKKQASNRRRRKEAVPVVGVVGSGTRRAARWKLLCDRAVPAPRCHR
jgi:Transposase DDE domain group 1